MVKETGDIKAGYIKVCYLYMKSDLGGSGTVNMGMLQFNGGEELPRKKGD